MTSTLTSIFEYPSNFYRDQHVLEDWLVEYRIEASPVRQERTDHGPEQTSWEVTAVLLSAPFGQHIFFRDTMVAMFGEDAISEQEANAAEIWSEQINLGELHVQLQ